MRQIHARPLASFSVFFLIGLIAGYAFNPPAYVCAAILIISAVLCFCMKYGGRRIAALFMLFSLCLGIGRMSYVLNSFSSVDTRYSVQITGKISSEPLVNPNTGRLIFEFDLESIDNIPSDMRVRLYLRGDETLLSQIEYGQTLSAKAHIWGNDRIGTPYEFDFGKYLNRSGLDAYATAKIEDVSILHARQSIVNFIIRARHSINNRINRLFPGNEALVQALILGDRTRLSDDLRKSFNAVGVTHLICISGMHVSVLAMVILFFLEKLISRKNALIISIVLLIAYGCLIGFSASFVRALIMFCIFSFAPVAGYPSDGITRLCAAMFIMLIIDPLQIMDAGFVLSFSATAGIILLLSPLTSLFGLKAKLAEKPSANFAARALHKAAIYLPLLLCTTIAAQMATIPAVVAYFGVQSIISIPVNLFCVPVCMLAYPISMLALAVSSVCMPLGMFLADLANHMFTLLVGIADVAASAPVTGIHIGRYPGILITLHAIIILASSDLSRISEFRRRFIPLALLLVAGISSLYVYSLNLGFSVNFLSAGQADCAVIRTQGHTYLMDTGDTYTPAADYLSATCLKIDGVFLSHPDQDHAGGLLDVLSCFRPDVIYVPAGWHGQSDISSAVEEAMAQAKSMNIDIIELSAGDTVSLSSDTYLSVHGPEKRLAFQDSNDISLVAEITHANKRILFTGDLPIYAEPAFIPNVDVLKVAHHGSSESTSENFLRMADPEIAVISVGENNFGHPDPETLNKLSECGAQVLRTDINGAITLRLLRDNTWQINTYFPLEESNELE